MIAHFWAQREDVSECTLIEADPTGGVLSGLLGLNLEIGIAPLVLAGNDAKMTDFSQTFIGASKGRLKILNMPLALRSSYDVASVFTNNHKTHIGATDTINPIVIDAGRLFHNSPCLDLVNPDAATLLVVEEGNISSLQAVAYLKELTERKGTDMGLFSIGKPLWSEKEYKESLGINLVGSLPEHPSGFVDLYRAVNPPNTSKIKAFYRTVRETANSLYDYTYNRDEEVFFGDTLGEEHQQITTDA